MLAANALISALLNLIVLGALPFFVYAVFQKRWNQRNFPESARRAGLQLGNPRYILYSLIFAIAAAVALILWKPPIESFTRQGSPQRDFVGLGLSGTSIFVALLYGYVKTGFPEELLFRGLIAGSLSRRLPFWRANVVQALIFLLPHLAALRVMPELWGMLPTIFAGALFLGWIRTRSGSILGSWLTHALLNVTICLDIAIRTAK
jgi:membrane protease YdiL (CAAX protease family)